MRLASTSLAVYVGMIENQRRLWVKKLVDLPGHFDFVMNYPENIRDPRNLMHFASVI